VSQAAGVSQCNPALAACARGELRLYAAGISAPPMAIAYGSGCVSLTNMLRHGFVSSWLFGIVVIALDRTRLCRRFNRMAAPMNKAS
jgi:di/tricarboxylate transporter